MSDDNTKKAVELLAEHVALMEEITNALNGHAAFAAIRDQAREALAALLEKEQPTRAVPEWTDEQCMRFASIAFRHAPKNLPDGVTLNDIRVAAMLAAAKGTK